MARFAAVVVVATILLGTELAPASALSCSPPPSLQEIIRGESSLGPLPGPYGLLEVESVTPTEGGVMVVGNLVATIRSVPVTRDVEIASSRDPMGSVTPMEDAQRGESWVLPLDDYSSKGGYRISICSGTLRVSDEEAGEFASAGEPPAAEAEPPSTDGEDRAAQAAVGVVLLTLTAAAVGLIRKRWR